MRTSRTERRSGRAWSSAIVIVALVALLLWLTSKASSVRAARLGDAAASSAVRPVGHGRESGPRVRTDPRVQDYLEWVAQRRPALGIGHAYAAVGITRLTAAIGALAARDAPTDSLRGDTMLSQMDALDRLASRVRQARGASRPAVSVRAAFETSAALLSDIQRRRYPAAADAVADVRAAARAVVEERPLLEQSREMGRFFETAAAALRTMDAAGARRRDPPDTRRARA